MYSNPYSTNNSIFADPFKPKYSDDRLAELYQNLERMKTQQINPNQKTVFSEIVAEFSDISDDEKRFIESSKEYMELSKKYQDEFSMFLIEYLGNDFLNSKYGKTPEEMLFVIRKKKEEYKNHFAENINEIRDKNNYLAERNDELSKANEELQKQLADIRKQLGGLKNAK